MKLITHFTFGLMLALLLVAPPAHAKLRKWNQKMQELGNTLTELLPELADSRPITPAGQKKLEAGAKKLKDLAHTINMGPDSKGSPLPPEADPTLGFVSSMFEREVKHAYNALKSGRTAYARGVLRNVTGYCIACHSRHDKGPDFPTLDVNEKIKTLSPIERAELYAATRQFDAALDEFEKITADQNFAKANQLVWGRAVRTAFNLSVRVKNDPDRALGIIQKLEKFPQVPGFYSRNIPAWKASLQEWKAEPKKTLNTEEGLFMEATRLTKAAKDRQEYIYDSSAEVLYLRSSALIHELLTKFPDGKRSSEALLMAGNAYDLLQDRLTFTLPEMYYEACVRNTPHTAIAEQCFGRFEQNVIFGYSGSAGTFIPDDIQSLLTELRGLATVQKK